MSIMKRGKKPEEGVAGNQESNSINLIGAGTNIVGEVSASGDIRIDGNLKGNLSTKGKLVIGPTGSIIGDIRCMNCDILGKVEGHITVEALLSLKATSTYQGEIKTNKLHIEPGAMFNGTCDMGGMQRSANLDARKSSKSVSN